MDAQKLKEIVDANIVKVQGLAEATFLKNYFVAQNLVCVGKPTIWFGMVYSVQFRIFNIGKVDEAILLLVDSFASAQQDTSFVYARVREDIGTLLAQLLDSCGKIEECGRVYDDLLKEFPTGFFIGMLNSCRSISLLLSSSQLFRKESTLCIFIAGNAILLKQKPFTENHWSNIHFSHQYGLNSQGSCVMC